MTDSSVHGSAFDRGYQIIWEDSEDELGPQNPLDGTVIQSHYFTLQGGIIYGKELPAMVAVAAGTTEVAASAVITPRGRAMSDADRLMYALTFPEIYQGAGSGVTFVGCMRVGASSFVDLGAGRALHTTRYRVIISIDRTMVHDP